MTEKTPDLHVEEEEEDVDGKINYKPPPQKSLQELQELDKDDESLAKYKKSLLGDGPVVADPTAPNVVVTRLTLVCDTAPGPITMDLTGDVAALKKETFVLKEGVEYRVKIHFKVNRDIVSGLKYVQHTYRTGVKDVTGDTKKPVLLRDIAATTVFISAAEVAVIGFFQELERPEVSNFHTVVGKIQEVPFGLSTNPEVLSHYNITSNTISIFRMVDDKRQDLELTDSKKMDATKMSRFIRINELRLVTEYNPVTAIGLFNSPVQTHLLLFTDKTSQDHTEQVRRYREAAELFRGKILFILVDSKVKGNERVISFFSLKKSQLPALAIFHTPDEERDVLPLGEVTVERVQDFCNGFLERKQRVSVQYVGEHLLLTCF
ncbi:Endoplasmic reticulum resident protein 27 [Chelonia mydas]|uniref:Endoplasmic reticulum resident protein 27 n=1 Tax=Chelonia mydas TaxID=8469 RepID=M7BUN0_CHEMY|nr:Endoplasmic reticulum resident protein 27 [Chelonia mydas]